LKEKKTILVLTSQKPGARARVKFTLILENTEATRKRQHR